MTPFLSRALGIASALLLGLIFAGTRAAGQDTGMYSESSAQTNRRNERLVARETRLQTVLLPSQSPGTSAKEDAAGLSGISEPMPYLDATKSLQKNKNPVLRRGTVRQMADRNDAFVTPRDQGAIAQYLAARSSTPVDEMIPKTRDGSDRGDEKAVESAKGNFIDVDLIEQGTTAFNNYCVSCHDAQKSLQQTKSLAAWRVTVLKMAEKEDADIPVRVHEAIAQYLASRSEAADGQKAAAMRAGADRGDNQSAGSAKGNAFDPALVQQGTTAFNNYCVSCHDAQKSLQQTKNVAAWRSTVRRMAEKDGAQIPEGVREPIAVYLASLGGDGKGGGAAAADATPSFSATSTFSAMFRDGGSSNLEDPGRFGDVWIGFAWQNKGPVSARVTTCITCHIQGLQLGNIDLVEACARLDLNKLICPESSDKSPVKANVEAGRFVVPFGAYYQQVNPGVNRAVTSPLIYNMGLRVYPNSFGDPVLPMPYSDSGASLNVTVPFQESTNVTFNGYMVNGLQGGASGVDFYQSRSYVDNNRLPAGGGRVTIGGTNLRLGTSIMGGRFNADAGTGPLKQGMHYFIYGADAVFRWKDQLRIQFEYAERDSDRLGNIPSPAIFQEHVGGYYLEGEALLSRHWHMSVFTRYDNQLSHSVLPPLGSRLTTGNFSVERLTYGLNWSLPGGSLLMLNLEQWFLPTGFSNVNVLGVRWAATF